MRITLVVATDLDGTIGRDGRLPWHLPDDLRQFKRLTMGKPVVMGRRTWESIGKPLTGRTNLVLSRDAGFTAPGAQVVRSVEAALAAAATAQRDAADPEAMVIGGAEVFRDFLPRASRIHWTLVDAHVPGDVRLPPFDPAEWRETERSEHPADARHAHAFAFRTLERIPGGRLDTARGRHE